MRFHEILFKQILKVSALYLEKRKSFIPKKKKLSHCQYQNKKALFTDPIFSDGFGWEGKIHAFKSGVPLTLMRFNLDRHEVLTIFNW